MDRKRKPRVSKKSITQKQSVKQSSKQKQVVNINLSNQLPDKPVRRRPATRKPPSTPPPPPDLQQPPSHSPDGSYGSQTIVMYQPASSVLSPPAFGGQIAGTAPGLGLPQQSGNRLGQPISRTMNPAPNLGISQGISGLSEGSAFDSIPPAQAQAYPYFPPQLETIPLDPVRISQNAGIKLNRGNPFRDDNISLSDRSIQSASNPFQGRSAESEIGTFEQTMATNELIRREEDPVNTNNPDTQDIIDEYTGQQIPTGDYLTNERSDSGRSQLATSDYLMTSPPPPTGRPRGRPFQEVTDLDRVILQQYVRIQNIPARQRSEQDRALFEEGRRLINAKRNNPYIASIYQTLRKQYLESGK